MKKVPFLNVILAFLLWSTLAACTAPKVQTLEPSVTDSPPAGIPNPASVYCEQKGNKLEIRTAADGSQNGICLFPDSSSCDEWAYFRGECNPDLQNNPTPAISDEPTQNASVGTMPPGTSEAIADWWGVIKSTESGAQYDDYFERQDLGQPFIYFGIDAKEQSLKDQIIGWRDSGKIVHLYGILLIDVPDYNGSQIQPDRIVVEE